MHDHPCCASSGEVLVPVVAFCHHISSLALSTTLQPTYQLFPSWGRICISGGSHATGNMAKEFIPFLVSSLYICIWVVFLYLFITGGSFLKLGSRVKVGNVLSSILLNLEDICKANISLDHMENDTFPLTEL